MIHQPLVMSSHWATRSIAQARIFIIAALATFSINRDFKLSKAKGKQFHEIKVRSKHIGSLLFGRFMRKL